MASLLSRVEIRSARLVIDLFDMPVDKRKAEPIVSAPLFAQSYLSRNRGRGGGGGGEGGPDCNFGTAVASIDIAFNRYQAHVPFICIHGYLLKLSRRTLLIRAPIDVYSGRFSLTPSTFHSIPFDSIRFDTGWWRSACPLSLAFELILVAGVVTIPSRPVLPRLSFQVFVQEF